jgi:hypothetical protein
MNQRHSLALLLASGLVIIILTGRFSSPAFAQPQPAPMPQIESAFSAVQAAEQAGANVTSLDAMLDQALSLVTEGNAIQATNPSEAQHLFTQAEAIATLTASDAKASMATGHVATERNEIFLAGELYAIGVACILVYLYLPRVFWRAWARVNSDSSVSQA